MRTIEGQRFGRLTVIEKGEKKHGKYSTWKCLCDCGRCKDILAGHLTRGSIRSCGCLKKEVLEKRHRLNIKHGASRTRLFRIWQAMNKRCNTPSHCGYWRYGGRGIKQLWASFSDFKNDMQGSYDIHCKTYGEENTSIDRIDNNDHYYKGNCRWATRSEQNSNQKKRFTSYMYVK